MMPSVHSRKSESNEDVDPAGFPVVISKNLGPGNLPFLESLSWGGGVHPVTAWFGEHGAVGLELEGLSSRDPDRGLRNSQQTQMRWTHVYHVSLWCSRCSVIGHSCSWEAAKCELHAGGRAVKMFVDNWTEWALLHSDVSKRMATVQLYALT